MRIGILGALLIERDGRPVEVAGGRLRALLARLALAAGRPVTSGALADAVWEGELPADQQHALQSLISRLRRSLADGDAIAPAPGGYRLAVEPDAIDAHRFERLATAGTAALRAGDPQRAASTLRDALALWRGPALADLTGQHFAVAAAAALEDLRLTALVDLAEAELALGRGASLVGDLEAAAAAHPLHERLAARFIAALFAAGRQADALAAYEAVRTRLAEELGAAPSPDLQAAHLAVLRGESSAPRAAPSRRSNLRAPVTSFVGREPELERIGALLGRSRLVTLVGPGGAGKTRLASEVLSGWVERVAGGVWMVELAPVTEELEIVPAVLAALGLSDGALLDHPGARPRDGLERLLDALADRESVILLDNCEHLIGHQKAIELDLEGVTRSYEIIVVLEDLPGLGPLTWQLADTGLLPSDPTPLVVHLHDLELICALVERPAQLIQYLERRRRLDRQRRAWSNDALDYFMNYLGQDGLFWPDLPDGENPPIRLPSFTDKLDAYFAHVEGARRKPAKRPRQRFHRDVRSLLELVEDVRNGPWLAIQLLLLDLNDAKATEVAGDLRRMKARATRDETVHDATSFEEGEFGLTVMAFPRRQAAEIERRLQSYCTLKKHQFQSDRWYGFAALAGNPRLAHAAVVLDYPWEPDAKLDRLVASLPSAEAGTGQFDGRNARRR